MLARIDVTIGHAEREEPASESTGYSNADRLMDDIDLMRTALAAGGAQRLSDALLLPLRRDCLLYTSRCV